MLYKTILKVDEYAKLRAAHHTRKKCAELLGVSYKTVGTWQNHIIFNEQYLLYRGRLNLHVGQRTTLDFIKDVYESEGDDYEVLSLYTNAITHIKMKHRKCGHVYKVFPTSWYSGCRCPKCKSSKGEQRVYDILNELKVAFCREKKFSFTRLKRFDFYLKDYHACIEYDGHLHFRAVDYFGGKEALEKQQRSDNIKNVYCMLNDIPLLRIPYWDYDRIPELVTQFINELQTEKEAA